MASFSERLAIALKARNVTQAELSKRINVNEGTISNYLKGKYIPKQIRLEEIAGALRVTIPWLMGGDSPMDPQLSQPPKGAKIPVLGSVPAGIPIEAVQDILDYEEISEDMIRSGEHFALRIKGQSMEPRMKEGDVVIVRMQETVDNGDIAVVMVNGDDATVKKFYRDPNGITLVPLNPAFDPFHYTPTETNEMPVRVIGKVVELRAKF